MSLDQNGVSLNAQGRAQSQSVVGQDMNLFVFDAFEYDDPNIVDYPVLRMKEPWSLEVPAIVSGRLDQLAAYLDRSMKQQGKNQDENEWALSQIKVGQNEIDIRVTGNLVTINEQGETINEQGETIDGHSTAFINLGIDPSGSSITIGADKVLIGGATHPTSNILDTFMTIDNTTKRLTIDGDIYADNGTFSGDITGSSGTFDDVDVKGFSTSTRLNQGELSFGYSIDNGVTFTYNTFVRQRQGASGGLEITGLQHSITGDLFINGFLDIQDALNVGQTAEFDREIISYDKIIGNGLVSFQNGRKLYYHYAPTQTDVYSLFKKILTYNNDGNSNYSSILFGIKEVPDDNNYYLALAHYTNSVSGANSIKIELFGAPTSSFTVTDGNLSPVTYNQYLL